MIAGNDPDPNCQYHQLISDAIKYRYRFHAVLPAPIPGEPPGINLSNVEWWQYIGLNERHNLAMAIKPYLEDRKAHWQSVCALRSPTDTSNGTESASRKSERAATCTTPGGTGSKECRKAKKPVRRNQKYKVIDEALRRDRREPAQHARRGFSVARWTPCGDSSGRAFYDRARMDRGVPSGRSSRPRMAFEAVGRVEPATFASRTEEPEEVVAVTTLGNYSQLP